MLMLLALHTALCQTTPEPQTFTVGVRATVVRDPRSPAARPLSAVATDEPNGAPGFVPAAHLGLQVAPDDEPVAVRVHEAVLRHADPPQVEVQLCSTAAVDLTVQLAVIEPSGRTSRQDVRTWLGSAGCIPVDASLWAVEEPGPYSVLGRVLGAPEPVFFSVTSAVGAL